MYKTIKVKYEIWRKLKKRAYDQDTTINKVIEQLVNKK